MCLLKKVSFVLFMGGLLLTTSCNTRKVEDGIYQNGPGGAAEEAAATDQAETTGVSFDTTAVIISADSAKKEQ